MNKTPASVPRSTVTGHGGALGWKLETKGLKTVCHYTESSEPAGLQEALLKTLKTAMCQPANKETKG